MFLKKTIIFFFLINWCGLFSAVAQNDVKQLSLPWYVEKGLANNPTLRDYKNQIQSLYYDSLLVRNAIKPEMSANGLLLAAPVINGYGYDEAITNGNTFSALVSFSQNLLIKKQNQNLYQGIRFEQQGLQNASKITVTDLKHDITRQYIAAWSANADVVFSQNMLDMLKEQKEVLKQLIESGLYSQSDYMLLEIEISAQQFNISQNKLTYLDALYELNQLCGISDTTSVVLGEPDMAAYRNTENKLHPAFQQFYIDSLKITNQLENIRLKFRPQLRWVADAGLNNSIPSTIYKNFGFSAGLSFSMPLNFGKEKKLELTQLSFLEDTRINYFTFYKTQYQQKLSILYTDIVKNGSLITMTENQLSLYKKLIAIDKTLLEKGSISVIDFITILKSFIATQNNLTQLKGKQMQLINELNYWNSR